MALAQGRLAEALTSTQEAADRLTVDQPVEAAYLLIDSAAAAAYMGDIDAALALDVRAIELAQGDPAATAAARAALGVGHLIKGESRQGLEIVLPMISSLERLIAGRPEVLTTAARIALGISFSDQFVESAILLTAVVNEAERVGAVSALPFAVLTRADINYRRGKWQEALAQAHQALSLARDMSQGVEYAGACSRIARIEAGAGQVDSCRRHIAEALSRVSEVGLVPSEAIIYESLGLLELGLRNIDASIGALEISRTICREYGLLEMGYWQWAPELSEAYARNNQSQQALDIAGELDWHAERTGRPIIKAFAARCRGFATETGYQSYFDEALQWHAQSERPFELARTQLCYGERLRRDKKRAEARAQLQQAWLGFRSLEAAQWAALARAELAATGVCVAPLETNSRAALLTPQELQVAQVTAGGATNRDAAAQLFLSPKTIEYHLSRIFRKLEITSRGQLSEALAVR